MGDMTGLPTLSDQRLIMLQKQSRRMRKSITILNDKLKARQKKLDKIVDKNKTSDEFRKWQHTLPYKGNLAEIRGLQKCLRRRRESSTLEPEATPRNGIYDGLSLDSMKAEVEAVIQEKNPRQRRLRKVEKFKNDGFRDGKIVDYEESMERFSEMIMNRPKGIMRRETCIHTMDHRPMSALDLLSRTGSPAASPATYDTASSPPPDSPPQFRLPPIQARRSTIANTSIITQARRRNFDVKSEGSVASMKRSMSFAFAR